MANIIDYINWRGDLTLKQSPFNCIDNLILSTISYINFNEIGMADLGKETLSLHEAGECFSLIYADEEMNLGRIIPKEIFTLLDMVSRSNRFKDMQISLFTDDIDEMEEKQFSAITVEVGNGDIAILFRGTDDTIVGWKEDFNMCFKSPVPSQRQAVKYLQKVAMQKRGKIYLGGHSKGGNLAIYAAANMPALIRRRIVDICSFDSPGFTQEFLQMDSYKAIAGKIKRIIPQSSMIGIMFEHDAKYEVVISQRIGLFQHDMFSWEIMGNDFVYVDEITASSNDVEHTMKEFIYAMSMEEREKFVNALFFVLEDSGAKTLSELKAIDILSAIYRMNRQEEQSKKVLNQAFRLLIQILEEKQLEKIWKK